MYLNQMKELEKMVNQKMLMHQRKQQTKKLKELVKKVENKNLKLKKLKNQVIQLQKQKNMMALVFMTGIMPHTLTLVFLNPQLILLILKDVQV